MGWIFTHREAGVSHLDWFRREFSDGLNVVGSDEASSHRLLALTSKGTTLYGAYRTTDGDVVAIVILTQRCPRDYYNYGYKDMDETMGPNEDDCPRSILELLTPLADDYEGYARDWRERAWANVARREARVKIHKGDIVRFSTPITFSDGVARQTFNYGGRNRFRSVCGQLCTIRQWHTLDYAVVS